jgi:hypothetical protein
VDRPWQSLRDEVGTLFGRARWRIFSSLLAIFSLLIVTQPQSAVPVGSSSLANRVLTRELDIATGHAQASRGQQHVSSGPLFAVLEASGNLPRPSAGQAAAPPLPPKPGTQGCSNVYTGTGPANIRVNQDCSQRRQAEEVIAVNPTNPLNLVAGQNDSRLGWNHCGYDWSFDGGKTWGDQIPPFYQFLMADGHTADACTDPTATFDAAGNAYVGGVLFDINSATYPSSAFIVQKSNAPIGGAFYHSPLAQPFQTYFDLPVGVIASDDNANIFNDKEYIVADSHSTSPKANNVYATWTRFNLATGAGLTFNSPINFSQSTDGGATWSPGIEISGSSATACPVNSGESNPIACDQDQGSDPIVGDDGTIYVSFNNSNVSTGGFPGVNQYLVVSCPATNDCSQATSWSAPQLIANDDALQPIGPNSTTGCPAGFQCLPPNGYRVGDDVWGTISVDRANLLYFTWSDFRHGTSNCVGSTTTATPPCNNDVFFATSSNGGASWSAAQNLTPVSRFGQTAQWMPWSKVTDDGHILYVAFYDRSYGSCEASGCNDITLAVVRNPAAATPQVGYQRITTSSMPNLVVASNPVQAGFLGDYMWLTTDASNHAYITWADTRGLNGAVEEDVYFATSQ